MLKKINCSNFSKNSPSITLVYSSASPIFQFSPKQKIKCPWHREHIYLINTATFTDFKNDILTGGFNCLHPSCRRRTYEYLLVYLGLRCYEADGGAV